MRQTDDFEDKSGGMPLVYMALGVSFFVLIIMGIVIAANKDNRRTNSLASTSSLEQSLDDNENEEADNTRKKITADDLDFWDMYPETDESKEEIKKETKEEKSQVIETSTSDSMDDGKHIKLIFMDDDRYIGTLSKTGSDHRGGDNTAHDMISQIF